MFTATAFMYRRLASSLHATRAGVGAMWAVALTTATLVLFHPLVLLALALAVLGAGLAAGSAEWLGLALHDRLHEPYRPSPLLDSIRADPPPGAAGATLSGSGPTVLVWARERDRCAAALADRRSRSTIIMVSHDVGTIKRYCERGLVLHRGQFLHFSDVDDAVTFYRKMSGV